AEATTAEAGRATEVAAPGTASLGGISPLGAARRASLNAFKDREMFRTDMRYIMGYLPGFQEFGAELTQLAETVLSAAYALCDGELRSRYGAPYRDDGRPSMPAICALGKCGGREMGFASDIELMFVYDGNGLTGGPQQISTAEYYEKLVPAVVQAIRARREGIFEIDLQLRPYGGAGSLAVSLASFQRYFAPGGPAWSYERQALIKLRPIAGDKELGRQVGALRDEFVYSGAPFDVAAMRAMRERQIRYMVSAGSFNAKFSLGGLVDVEYLVQGLQISHGHKNPRLRSPNTAEAMAALTDAGLLTPEDHAFLRQAHAFLWRLIEALRVVRGNAKDLNVPPVSSEEFGFLARRLGYGRDVTHLQDDISTWTAGVRRMVARL
ncbi:MAG TPA: glutamate-ammonia-ligase adenylyltransferase, partial [Anaerolineae bacterium]